jgi:hypothetical protein
MKKQNIGPYGGEDHRWAYVITTLEVKTTMYRD